MRYLRQAAFVIGILAASLPAPVHAQAATKAMFQDNYAEVNGQRLHYASIGKGDLVRHAMWGDGEVLRVVGDSALTFFPSHGEKLLKLSFLERV